MASSCYGFSGDETVTAGTITPSQMTLQAMTDDEEDFEESEDFFTGSLPSIVDSLGNYLNHNFEVWDVLRPIWKTTAVQLVF